MHFFPFEGLMKDSAGTCGSLKRGAWKFLRKLAPVAEKFLRRTVMSNKKKSFSPSARPYQMPPQQVPLFNEKPLAQPKIRDPLWARESDPLLYSAWVRLRQQYFPTRPDIDEYQVVWSARRQRRTLASCTLERRKVRVARELNCPDFACWLEPLLYHEMCHAYLGLMPGGCHGPAFKALERRHPSVQALNSWIKSGGWLTAVRQDRGRRAHAARQKAAGKSKKAI